MTSTKHRARLAELNRQAEDPNLWNDPPRAQPGDAGAHRARRAAYGAHAHLTRSSTTRSTLIELGEAENDQNLIAEAEAELAHA